MLLRCSKGSRVEEVGGKVTCVGINECVEGVSHQSSIQLPYPSIHALTHPPIHSSNLCVHGRCMDVHEGYMCECDDGFEGVTCQHHIPTTHNATTTNSLPTALLIIILLFSFLLPLLFIACMCHSFVHLCSLFAKCFN